MRKNCFKVNVEELGGNTKYLPYTSWRTIPQTLKKGVELQDHKKKRTR